VTITETVPSTNVKSSTVLSIVKMLGELNTVQNLKPSIVLAHSLLPLVMVLGLVTISSKFLLKSLPTMILMVMVKSILETILMLNT